MAGPYQAQLVYDASTFTNFLSWSKNFISANLSTMGWTRTTDAGQVVWANITSNAHIPTVTTKITPSGYTYRGAWVQPTGYTNVYNGSNVSSGSQSSSDVVTNAADGLTYHCLGLYGTRMNTAAQNLSKIIQQTALSITLTAVGMSGTTMTLTMATATPSALNPTSATVTASDGTAGTGYITYNCGTAVDSGNQWVGYPFSM